MKGRIVSKLVLVASMSLPMIAAMGCAQEVSHTETDKPGWFGGHKHEETTVYKNADGTTSVEHEKHTTNP